MVSLDGTYGVVLPNPHLQLTSLSTYLTFDVPHLRLTSPPTYLTFTLPYHYCTLYTTLKLQDVFEEYESHYKLRFKFPRTPTGPFDFNLDNDHYVDLRSSKALFRNPADNIVMRKSRLEALQKFEKAITASDFVAGMIKQGQEMTHVTFQNLQSAMPTEFQQWVWDPHCNLHLQAGRLIWTAYRVF